MQEPHPDDVFATATWTADDAYHRQLFDDWMQHVSRQRRYLLPVAAAFVVLGVVLLALGERYRSAGSLAAVGGLLGAAWHVWDRSRWLRRVSDGSSGPITMTFTADTVYTQGPDSQGECGWRAFLKAKLAEHGLFLWLSRGLHVYLPYDAITPREAAAAIAERVNAGE